MKTLIANGEEWQAKKIVKSDTDIVGYDGKTEVFAFRGIKDFSNYQLAGGQEWDTDELEQTQQTVADLIYQLMMVGVI